jgi:2-C-methyl-D-erythritol 4-phosphate cytidylyltransferase
MYLTAIVVAAGRGLRFRSKVSKPLVKISRQPIIIYCLRTLSRHPYVKDIIVVANSLNARAIKNALKRSRISKIRNVVLGGPRRQDSVSNGLKELPLKADMVLIHDAARPFIESSIITRAIKSAVKTGAAVVGVPAKATIKKAVKGDIVGETLNRGDLWEIQTPQVFRKNLLLQAYRKFGGREATDDASLVESLGVKVSLVMGSYFNIKITTPEDLIIAGGISKAWKRASV